MESFRSHSTQRNRDRSPTLFQRLPDSDLPAESFKQIYPGQYAFLRISNGVAMQVRIAALSANRYAFAVDAKGSNLAGRSTPLSVTLTIGDDSGMTAARGD